MRHTALQEVDDELRVFYTVPEVAQILRTTDKAIYAQAERGLLPGVTRIGRRLLFRRAELLVSCLRKSLVLRVPPRYAARHAEKTSPQADRVD
jgi:excisionase family DNA binding protein